jgi:hypothetical protein
MNGQVDVVLEMDYHARPPERDRRRRVMAYSRFDDTPLCLVIELSECGTDYCSLGDFEESAFRSVWETLQLILAGASAKLTRPEIVEQWPADRPAPSPATLWRFLDRAVADGLVFRDGEGRRGAPHRYWSPALEEKWKNDPLLKQQAETDEALRQLLAWKPPGSGGDAAK